jgi:hypothetical protein
VCRGSEKIYYFEQNSLTACGGLIHLAEIIKKSELGSDSEWDDAMKIDVV